MLDRIGSGRDASNIAFIAWVCIALGTGIIFFDGTPLSVSIAAPFSLVGIALLLYAIGWAENRGMSATEVSDWTPGSSILPDAGRPMYRIDTTLEEPIRTSILCGRCSHIEWVIGSKPNEYSCVSCETQLWTTEEE